MRPFSSPISYRAEKFSVISVNNSKKHLTKRFMGNGKNIKPFTDPRFENNIILTGTEFLTANARNLNCCVVGSSGSGKIRFWLTPQLLQAHSSYVVVDPKAGCWSRRAFSCKRKRDIKSRFLTALIFPAPCTTTR